MIWRWIKSLFCKHERLEYNEGYGYAWCPDCGANSGGHEP